MARIMSVPRKSWTVVMPYTRGSLPAPLNSLQFRRVRVVRASVTPMVEAFIGVDTVPPLGRHAHNARLSPIRPIVSRCAGATRIDLQ